MIVPRIYRRKEYDQYGDLVEVVGYPHPGQMKVLEAIFAEPSTEVKPVDLCCGRGYGKTTLAIDVAQAMLSLGSTQRGIFLEPDVASINDNFLDWWIYIVPEHLYKLNEGKRQILWLPTGAKLKYGPRIVTGNKLRAANKYKGRNTTFVLDDETADTFNPLLYTSVRACIRGKSPIRLHGTFTTPAVGPYAQMIKGADHIVIKGTSYDNPFLDPELIEQWKKEMHRDEFRREVLGELISLEGRVFKEALVDAVGTDADPAHRWPKGNVNWGHTRYDPNKPWWLACDIGSATGAFVVIQKTHSEGRYPGSTWVAVADLCPQNDGNASRAFQRLNAELGRPPAAVVGGADAATRDSIHGDTLENLVKEVWGEVPIYLCNEALNKKQNLLDAFSRLICSATDDRRFTIAKHFKSLDKDSHRGVRETLLEYTYRPPDQRRENETTPKGADQPLCHCADALMMWANEIAMPPGWRKTKILAK